MKHINTKCPYCGQTHIIIVNDEQYDKYCKNEENIQNIFPDLDAPTREMLITGICPKCWKKIFNYKY